MHWARAVIIAKHQEDVTYEEWCAMYINHRAPTEEQVIGAMRTVRTVLTRNGHIAAETPLTYDPAEFCQ